MSTPGVANGIVYAGMGDGTVVAFDARTGSRLWTAATGRLILSSPAIADGVVYIGSVDAESLCLRRADGCDALDLLDRCRGDVLAGGRKRRRLRRLERPPVVRARRPDRLRALDRGGLQRIESTPAVVNGVVYVGSNNVLYAFAARTGAPLWSRPTSSRLRSPAVAYGMVYVG